MSNQRVKQTKTGERTAIQVIRDRGILFGYFLQGYPYRLIREAFNKTAGEKNYGYTLSLGMVHNDVKAAIGVFRLENDEFIDEQMHVELARINKLETTYWKAWENSTTGRTKREYEGGIAQGNKLPRGAKLKKYTSEELFGDPRYLHGVQWCVDRRCKLLGLDKPIEITGTLSLYEFMKRREEKSNE